VEAGLDAKFEHISGGGGTSWPVLGAGLQPGDVVIFCSRGEAPATKRQFDIEFREKGEGPWRPWSTGWDRQPPKFHPDMYLDAFEFRVVEYELVPVKATAFPEGK
jgi:hypothetical protein